uniref:Uncharacterized protein n=1 Tax=Glossina palpalis gambiensis TaxID=67801 RepID=A0A1B0BVC2_9MUSC
MAKIFDANLEFVREDDYVEYFLFPELIGTPSNIDDESMEDVRKQLENIKDNYMALVGNLIKEHKYIWHKDEFQLLVRTCSKQELLLNDEVTKMTANAKESKMAKEQHEAVVLPPHLHGVTHYGDNIADEWFVVFLLTEVTKTFTNCVARIIDADGEFLLIEAADVLPKWANPDTCDQRVYLSQGHLHLVQNSPSNTNKIMPVESAITKIRSNPTLYRVSKEIQFCIDKRLKEFESVDNLALHHQIVRLPLGVAILLKKRPSLIAAAVRAFCERDVIDMKVCRSMRYFPPEQRVRTNVCFTRCLYAMIMHTDYTPDRKIGWHLNAKPNSEEYKEDLLGIKLACGFEILASQAKDVKADANSPAWKAYVKSLLSKGYFRDNIEGSAEYQYLLEQAKAYFAANQIRFRTAAVVGTEILDLLKQTGTNADELRDEENNLKLSDPDDWLNVSVEELDAMLVDRYGPKKIYKSNGDLNAEEFTKNISEFLEKQSAFEGIERDSDDVTSNDEEPKINKTEKFGAKVKKNLSMRKACRQNPLETSLPVSEQDESFSTQVRNFLEFTIPEDTWDSQSEMSDYEDEDDIEHNFSSMAGADRQIDADIKAYMDEMDKELAKTTIGQTFVTTQQKRTIKTKTSSSAADADDDDFDDIEAFEPININVNTLKSMMDSYKSQLGGAGPVTHLLNAMGAGMSAATTEEPKDLSESTV